MILDDFIDQTEGWLERLLVDYQINAVIDGDLVSLKYDQIESPMREPIVQQCRGVVVHMPTGKILARPYDKFWNHGEALAAPINWSNARVLEKLDGSLMTLYWNTFEQRWAVASSGHPTAGGPLGKDKDRRFRDLFWEVFRGLEMKLPERDVDRDFSYMFELCAAENRIVVRHEKPRLVLHGVRDRLDGTEFSGFVLKALGREWNWEVVKSFPIRSISECLAAAAELDPLSCEGFVVVDRYFNRVKIKSPRYVILHHMKGNATPRRAIQLWQTGESEELLSHFPEMAADILPWHAKLDAIAESASKGIATALENAITRRDFAMLVKDQKWSSVAFKMLGTGTAHPDEVKKVMRGQSLACLERMLDLKESKEEAHAT